MVGYKNGSLRIYDVTGFLSYTCTGHNSAIVKIESMGGYGWLSLDSSGTAMRWSIIGGIPFATWTFNQTVLDMSVTGSGMSYWVGFNLGSSVK